MLDGGSRVTRLTIQNTCSKSFTKLLLPNHFTLQHSQVNQSVDFTRSTEPCYQCIHFTAVHYWWLSHPQEKLYPRITSESNAYLVQPAAAQTLSLWLYSWCAVDSSRQWLWWRPQPPRYCQLLHQLLLLSQSYPDRSMAQFYNKPIKIQFKFFTNIFHRTWSPFTLQGPVTLVHYAAFATWWLQGCL